METLHRNIDYLLLSFFYIGFFFLLSRRMRDAERGGSFPRILWALLFFILGLGFFLTERAAHEERERLEKMVKGFAPTYAEELTRLGHERLGLSADPQDPLYLKMIETEKRWLQLNPAISDIYTLRKDGEGNHVFLVDSETDYDRNGKIEGLRESRTQIGERYDIKIPGLDRAFAGEANFYQVPVHDRWGTWVSAYVPMFGSNGKVEAVLGVDFPAADWQRLINNSRWLVMAFLAGVLMILAVSLTVISQLRFNIHRREQAEEELKETAQDLAIAKQVAERASHTKSEFMANMSHEIRTPLAGILGMADLLLEKHPREDQKENLETLRMSAEDLSELLNNVLDLTKIEADKVVPETIDFDPREVLQRAVKTLEAKAQQRGLSLRGSADPRLSFSLRGDPVRLRQVLLNLIGNAVKFTETGWVEARANLAEQTAETTRVRFTVSDSGVGIPKDQQKRIFESFTQADSSTSRRYGGTGLGLAISSKLVGLMGGTLEVQSEAGRGSEFSFELSFPKGVASLKAEPGSAKSPPKPREVRSLHILLAEDNRVNQQVASELLSSRGHRVSIARNGNEVLSLLEEDAFDLVLMDVQMPEMDGYQTAQVIREREKNTTTHLPIFAMTAHAMPEDRKKCLESGMDRVLSKPVERERLFREIEIFFGNGGEKFRPEALWKHLEGDIRLLKEISSLFFEDSRACFEKLTEAMNRKDAADAERQAHALKGMIGNFAFPAGLSAGDRMERACRGGDWQEANRACEDLRARWEDLNQGLEAMLRNPPP